MAIGIQTRSGGTVDFSINKDRLNGTTIILHIDQSYNEKNGEGEASIAINIQECKDIIGFLNDLIKYVDGTDFVFSEESVIDLLSDPKVQKALLKAGYHKS